MYYSLFRLLRYNSIANIVNKPQKYNNSTLKKVNGQGVAAIEKTQRMLKTIRTQNTGK